VNVVADRTPVEPPQPRVLAVKRRGVDRTFRGVVTFGGLSSFIVQALIAGFLLYRGFELFRDYGLSFITSAVWDATGDIPEDGAQYGIAAMLVGTLVTALIAVVVSLPFVVGTALYLEFYAPARLRKVLVSVLDLIAAIPSIVYGLWGYLVLVPIAAGWASSLNRYLGWFPLFDVPTPIFERSPFAAGLILSLMMLPIATSVAREVYSHTPREQLNAAYALGGSRWGAIKEVALPYGRSGLVGGMLLGMGRALGETVAVLLTLNLVFDVNLKILASAGGNVASLIASKFPEAAAYEIKALLAAGFVLFCTTLLVNVMASFIVRGAERKYA
jgi:phosphate transport system permease protein